MKQKLLRLIVLASFLAGPLLPADPSPTDRTLVIAVAANAPPAVQQAAASILAAVPTQPLLQVMAGNHPPTAVADSVALAAGKPAARAYSHLVVVGLPDDPLIAAGWQREALLKSGDFYIFGFGHLLGDIGYIESDRNPFLHSRWIPTAPYETEMVTISGSTPAGVTLAAQAFINQGLTGGVVAGPGWQRGPPNLLEHAPLDPTFALPGWVPAQLGEWTKIGVVQAGEDEYRGVEVDTGSAPLEIWQVKYYKPGVWDKPGAAAAFENYSAGLHRRAYGNTLWLARFKSADEAAAALPKIAHQAQLSDRKGLFQGQQPYYGSPTPEDVRGSLSLWQRDDWILMSTLPKGVAEEGVNQTAKN